MIIIGQRIRRLREARGLSRPELAGRLSVDVTALASWEGGKYLPRDGRRTALASELGIEVGSLFAPTDHEVVQPGSASLLDTFTELPGLVERLLPATRCLRALRIAAPYATPSHIQQDFRITLSERLLAGTIEVQRIEIFYSLDRLKEALWNILKYDPATYNLKSFCPGISEVTPAMGGYFFDNKDFLVGAYWTGVPPHNRPGLHLSGEPFATYFREYWDEIWRRGTLLNMRGGHDLTALRETAFALGLVPEAWPQFVDEARALEIGDGAPPLV